MAIYEDGGAQVVGKEIAQSAPSATVASTLYTCGTARGVKDVVVYVANRSTATTFRVWIAKAGAADANAQYRAYDATIGVNGIAIVPIGDLEKTDLIRIYAGTANLSFQANGKEIQ